MNGRPGDQRGFIHKKIFGGIKGAASSVVRSITSGSLPTPLTIARGAAGGFFIPGGGSRVRSLTITTPRPTPPRSQTARVSLTSQAEKNRARTLKFSGSKIPLPPIIEEIISSFDNGNGNGNGECDFPLVRLPGGGCEFPGSPRGEPGEARMGRYGAALDPMFRTINQRVCLEGMILGKDRLCYNKGAISNKERLWPRGTPPLLTGGEMACIRKADTARGKVARTAKRLGIQTATRRASPKRHAHARPIRAVSIPA